MVLLWLLLALPFPAWAAIPKTSGVHPSLLPQYAPVQVRSASMWKCLDGSKQIPWSAVNDDYCDCADGSDEPGTSACPNGRFYCLNEGHIGATILSSRVNDGLCEPECCDGSDEPSGVCPNICREAGEVYHQQEEAARKLRKTGSKIRSTYIAFAEREKKRLEVRIHEVEQEIAIKAKEAERLRGIAEHAESLSAAEIERKKKSPLYASLLTHHTALKSLQREHKKHLEREKSLGDILDTLRSNYNPNYQDMAVLEAVRGWETLEGLPHINDVQKDDSTVAVAKNAQEEEEAEEGVWTAKQIEKELDRLLKTDYVSLLLEHERHITSSSPESLLFDITAYLPDSIIPQYQAFKESLLSLLRSFGVVRGGADISEESSRARKSLTEAEQGLNKLRTEETRAREDLDDIFNPEVFGLEGEWKKLDGLCLEKESGDYTYEVCLFNEAKQKPNKGGTSFSLGKFTSWNVDSAAQPGELNYYTQQHYTSGAKCWNGPNRKVDLILSCGTENALLSVIELEKCEYQITGTTPALCRPLEEDDNITGKEREEL